MKQGLRSKARLYIALTQIANVGMVRIGRLTAAFGSIEAVFDAPEHDVAHFLAASFGGRVGAYEKAAVLDRADAVIADAHARGIGIVSIEDEEYPFNLKNIDSPPPVLYVRGDITALSRNAVGIVGTRHPSETAQRYAFTLASNLAALNVWVISGLAKGIDAAAHWGAVSASGATVGVLGSGQDTIYPAENAALYEKIVEKGGVIISEYPVGTRPLKHHYPLRNRIISGLSYGIVVAEAGGKSGALITARYALDQGREVFIGPYRETDERAFGNHRLARDGAKTAATHEDVIVEFANLFALDATYRAKRPHFSAMSAPPEIPSPEEGLSPREKEIYRAIGEAKHIDDIALTANMPVHEAASLLMQMEIKGTVRQNPGKYFVRN